MTELKKAEKLLRKGRLSIPGARYFLTCCTEQRGKGLTNPGVRSAIISSWRELHMEGSIQLKCATIMPDHVHALIELGSRLRLAQVIGKFKTSTGVALQNVGLHWQENYYDHRLRADVAAESFSKYIFLNPYQSGLITTSKVWPGWICNREYKPEFLAVLDDPPVPPDEWIKKAPTIADLIEEDTQ